MIKETQKSDLRLQKLREKVEAGKRIDMSMHPNLHYEG